MDEEIKKYSINNLIAFLPKMQREKGIQDVQFEFDRCRLGIDVVENVLIVDLCTLRLK